MEEGDWTSTEVGSPQGGVISPLLANIYLHVLDMYWAEQCTAFGKLIRYADDSVVICRTKQEAEQALEKIKRIMTKIRLTLHPTKTRIVDMGREGFDFLGFHFHKMKSKKTSKLAPYMWPGQKAMKSVRRKIHEITTRKRLSNPPEEVVKYLNLMIRGWRNYFRMGNSTKKFQDLDRYVRLRLRQLARARKGARGVWSEKAFATWMKQSGLVYFYPSGVCGA
jgi:group II intron reverse transcriptase/maturase